MYLVIDGQPLQALSRTRGIGRYSGNLVAALRSAQPDWRIEVVVSPHLPPPDPGPIAGCRLRRFEPPFLFKSENADLCERYYADWLTSLDPDALLFLDFFRIEAWVPRFTGPRPPLFGVLYDLIPLLFPPPYLGRSLADFLDYASGLRRMAAADGLLAISEASARDFRRLVPAPRPQVVSVGGAADAEFRPLCPADQPPHRARLRERFGLEREFVLYVGGPDFRKNLAGALEAFARLPAAQRDGLDLVVACFLSPDQVRSLEARGRELGISHSLKLTGYVSDDELRSLYQLCRVFFFPSLYEGLGLPVLEALQCGAPVVAADNSSVPEFAGDVAWLTDAHSTERLADALGQALAEPPALRRTERVAHARTFTWQRCAEAVSRMLTKPVQARGRRKPRVAWVAALPPLRSPAADLLPYLASRYDIEVVTPPGQFAVDPAFAADFPRVRSTEVPARHAACPYDLFVYHVGTGQESRPVLELLARYPGLVVLHRDVPAAELLRGAEGVIAGSPEVWQGAREAVRAPVACLPAALPHEERLARYVALMDMLIAHRSDTDAGWVNFAVHAMKGCADPATARESIDRWAELRTAGQQLQRARRQSRAAHEIPARQAAGRRRA